MALRAHPLYNDPVRLAMVMAAACCLSACDVLLPLGSWAGSSAPDGPVDAAHHDLRVDRRAPLPDSSRDTPRPVDGPDPAQDAPPPVDGPDPAQDTGPAADQMAPSCSQPAGWSCTGSDTDTCFLGCGSWEVSCWWEKSTKTSSCHCRFGTSMPVNCAAGLPETPEACGACIAAQPGCCP